MLFESSTTYIHQFDFFLNFDHKLFTTQVFANYFDFGDQELFCFGINLAFFICEFNTAWIHNGAKCLLKSHLDLVRQMRIQDKR